MTDVRLLRILRIALAAVIVVDLFTYLKFIGEELDAVRSHGGSAPELIVLLAQPAVAWVVAGLGACAALRFASQPGRIVAGFAALVALGVLGTVHAQLYGSPWRHMFYSGSVLLGWLCGLLRSRRHGDTNDESYARTGALALLSATYLNAGLSKLLYGGVGWVSGTTIQTVVVGHDGLVADRAVSALRAWSVATPGVAAALSIGTVLLELGAPLMLLGRRSRIAIALGLLAMHFSILVLADILYWQSIAFLTLLGVVGSANLEQDLPGDDALRGDDRRNFALAATALSICIALGLANQGRVAAEIASKDAAPLPHASDTGSNKEQPKPDRIGPFELGQRFADGWTLDSLRVEESAVLLGFNSEVGTVGFELTCAETEQHSPFDVGPLHVFYSSALDTDQLKPLGLAVKQLVTTMSEKRDACVLLRSWVAETN